MQKPIAFAIFILLVAAIVPLFIRFFVFLAARSGNQRSGLVMTLQQHSGKVVMGVWAMIALSLMIALPFMIKTGFFENEDPDPAQSLAAATGNGLPETLYPVPQKKVWGYMDNNFRMVMAPMFTTAGDFHEGKAAVGRTVKDKVGGTETELFGYIDSMGKELVKPVYERAADFSEGMAAVMRQGKYGFLNDAGKEVVSCIYEEVSRFSEGLACVKKDGLNGFINASGEMVIAPRYHRACWVSDFHEGLAAVYTSAEGPAGYIDKKGNMAIPAVYKYAGEFADGLALVQPAAGSKFGYIDHQGKLVIPPKFELSLPFTEGVASVQLLDAKGNTVYNIIDKNGKFQSKDLPYGFVGIFRGGLAGFETSAHTWGFLDKTGKVVIEPKYSGVKLFHNGLARMQAGHPFKKLKTVYINTKGEVVWQEE